MPNRLNSPPHLRTFQIKLSPVTVSSLSLSSVSIPVSGLDLFWLASSTLFPDWLHWFSPSFIFPTMPFWLFGQVALSSAPASTFLLAHFSLLKNLVLFLFFANLGYLSSLLLQIEAAARILSPFTLFLLLFFSSLHSLKLISSQKEVSKLHPSS